MEVLPPPGPARQRQLLLLAGASVVLAAVVWYVLIPSLQTSPASNRATGNNAAGPAGQLPVPEAIKLDALQGAGDSAEAGRNLFVFGQRQEPSVPGSTFVLPPQPAVVPAGPPPPPPGPPAIPLRLTGLTVAEPGGRTMATLKDTGTNVLHQAFEGDIVDGRYRVVRVGIESVVVSYVDGSGQRTLALGG